MSNISDEQRRSAREAAAAQVADLRHDPETCDVCTSFAIDRWLEVADRFKDDLLDEAIRLKAALGYTPDWLVVLNSGYETVDSIRKVLAWRDTDWNPELCASRPDLVGRPELAIHTWVLKPQYHELFTDYELAMAREWLGRWSDRA